MNESFGMMDSGYFIGRNEILKWVNDTLKVPIQHPYTTIYNLFPQQIAGTLKN